MERVVNVLLLFYTGLLPFIPLKESCFEILMPSTETELVLLLFFILSIFHCIFHFEQWRTIDTLVCRLFDLGVRLPSVTWKHRVLVWIVDL